MAPFEHLSPGSSPGDQPPQLPPEFDLVVERLKSPGAIVLMGGPGSGKTTWLNAAMAEIRAADETSVIVGASGSLNFSAGGFIASILKGIGLRHLTEIDASKIDVYVDGILKHLSKRKFHLYLFIDDLDTSHLAGSLADKLTVNHPYIHLLATASEPERNATWLLKSEMEFYRIPKRRPNFRESGFQQPLSVFVDPGSSSVAEIADFFSALADLQRACGGFGITIRDGESRVYSFDSSCV